MNNKTAAQIVLSAAAIVFAAGVAINVETPIKHDSHIVSAEVVAPGQLTVLRVDGTDVNWRVYPEVAYTTYGEGGNFLATSFPSEGEYLVVCAFLDAEGKVQLDTTVVIASYEQAVTPETEHVEPTPEPTPAPAPEPAPEPVPDPVPNSKYPEAYLQVVDILNDSDAPKDAACSAGANFQHIANQLAAGEYKSEREAIRDTAQLNKTLNLGPSSTRIQLIISKMRFQNELTGLSDYADLWSQIAKGLSDYGQCT